MQLRQWEVENYRSIKSSRISPRNSAILIGKNNSGKSNVLESILEYSNIVNSNPSLENWFSTYVRDREKNRTVKFKGRFELSNEEYDNIMSWVSENITSDSLVERLKYNDEFSDFIHEIKIGKEGLEMEEIRANFSKTWVTIYRRGDFGKEELKYEGLSEERFITPEEGNGKLKSVDSSHSFYRTDKRSQTIKVLPQEPYRSLLEDFCKSIDYIGAIRRPKDSDKIRVHTDLYSDAKNLTTVLHTLSQNEKQLFNKIVSKYTNIMENVTDVRTPIEEKGNTTKTTIKIDEKGASDGFHLKEISSGSKEILSLITKIVLAQEETSLLLVEEPELHLHPDAEQEVYDLLQEVATRNPQVIVTTHSDLFVNQSDAGSIIRVERENTETTLRHIPEGQIDTELSDLGYDKSGLLQSEAVVLVEGQSDERVLRQFAQTCGLDFDREGIKLVELDGEGNIRSDGRSLVKLLFAFDVPYVFVVDSHGSPPSKVQDNILQHINSRKGDWHITPDHIHVWDGYGIEDFLTKIPHAIQSVVGGDVADIKEIIQNYDGEEKAEVLNEIFQSELGEPYDKNQHGMLIAKQADEEAIPAEVKEVVEKIRNLPE